MDFAPRFTSLFYRRRLVSLCLPFLAALYLLLLFPRFLLGLFLFLVGISLVVFAIAFENKERRTTLLLFALGIALALACVGMEGWECHRLSRYHGLETRCEGTVTAEREDGFDVRLSSPASVKARITSEEAVSVGDRVAFDASLSSCLSTAQKSQDVDLLGKERGGVNLTGRDFFYSFVGRAAEYGKSAFGEGREGGFFRSVLLGDRSELAREDEKALRDTASSHLLAISGLHVALVLGFVHRLLRLFSVPPKRRGFFVLPIAVLFLFFTGASVSVFRASLMAAFPLISVCMSRRSDSLTAWAFAAAVLGLWEPYSLLSPSFLLSFASTLGIILAASPLSEALYWRVLTEDKKKKGRIFRLKLTSGILSSLAVSVSVFVFQLPIQLFLFGEADLLSPLYALLLIPLFSPCALLGLIALLLSPVPWLGTLAKKVAFFIGKLFLDFTALLAPGASEGFSFGSLAIPMGACLLGVLLLLVLSRHRIHSIFFLYLALSALFLFLGLSRSFF